MTARRPASDRKKPVHWEDLEQSLVVQWAALARLPEGPDTQPGARVGDYLFAVPNGGRRASREAARLVQTGVKAGVSDMVLALPRGGYHGLYLELKKGKAQFRSPRQAERAVSPEQRVWLERTASAGYCSRVAYGADEAIKIISAYTAARPTLATPHPRELIA